MTIDELELQRMLSVGASASIQIYDDDDYHHVSTEQIESRDAPWSVSEAASELAGTLIRLAALSTDPSGYLDELERDIDRSASDIGDKARALEALRLARQRLAGTGDQSAG